MQFYPSTILKHVSTPLLPLRIQTLITAISFSHCVSWWVDFFPIVRHYKPFRTGNFFVCFVFDRLLCISRDWWVMSQGTDSCWMLDLSVAAEAVTSSTCSTCLAVGDYCPCGKGSWMDSVCSAVFGVHGLIHWTENQQQLVCKAAAASGEWWSGGEAKGRWSVNYCIQLVLVVPINVCLSSSC